MGNKSDEKQSEKRAHKATDSSANSKHKNRPSFTALGSSPFAAKFEATDDEGARHTRWRNHFRHLCEFKAQFGHCLVPKRYAANHQLRSWVSTQRARYRLHQKEKSDSVTAEHIRALEGIGFNWGRSKTDLASILWSVRFQQMCEFKAQFGHCLVPQRCAANPKLGHWVSTQRNNYRLHQEGKPSPMTEERIRELESVGFNWGTSKTCLASIWSVRFQQVCEFKAQFGHCLVPRRYAANHQLGHWVSIQRNNYRLHQEGKPSPMTEERIRELESVGFNWGTSKTGLASIWSVRFQQVYEFKAQFGHCLVPTRCAANPKLGHWVSTQRNNYRLHKEGKPSPMTDERIRELESIGFEWGASKTGLASIWSVRFQEICEFKAQFGHCLVTQRYAANPKLGLWVSTQRRNYRLHQEGKPSPMIEERIRALDAVGFDWGTSKSKTDLSSIWSEAKCVGRGSPVVVELQCRLMRRRRTHTIELAKRDDLGVKIATENNVL
jgi:hypothetical protein